MLIVKYTKQFQKDYKLMIKRGLDVELLKEVIQMLANGEKLPIKYRDHYLTGKYRRF